MSHVPHELADEFPEHAERMQRLKETDARFSKIFDDYHQLNATIHRAETNVEPVGEVAEHDMRKRRMVLKDEIYRALSADASA